MKPQFKNYNSKDYEAVCDFLIELNRKSRNHINWNWGRFEWMMELMNSIGIWIDDDRVVGAAIYDMYFGEAFVGVLPEYSALYPESLDYAYRELKDENGLGIAICDTCFDEICTVESTGFEIAEQTEIVMRIDLNKELSVDLPDGLYFAELDPVKELVAFQWLLWQGFDHGTDKAEYERDGDVFPEIPEFRKHFIPSLSIAAKNGGGEYVSYCCLWYSGKTDYAYVEPRDRSAQRKHTCCPICRFTKNSASARISISLSIGKNEVYSYDTYRVAHVTERFFPFSLICVTFKSTDLKGLIELKRNLTIGIFLLIAFALWTVLIMFVDVQAVGVNGSKVGFATFNAWFHQLTGVHWTLYTVTDWLGLVPLAVCLCFGCLGLCQLIKRRSLFKVDADILLLGGYYILAIFGYLFFEMVPINYRPVLINGFLEASYPSSTTLLVLSVMPTLLFQINRRSHNKIIKNVVIGFVLLFSAFMVIGRLISGVHWATDIIGSVLLSFGLFKLYQSAVTATDMRNKNGVQ